MDVYSVWCDLKPGVRDMEFSDALHAFLGRMKSHGHIEGYRLLRRKLGLGPRELGEWHVLIETRDLAQLDRAFREAASRAGETELAHFDVNRLAANLTFGLSRDFPDSVRETGEELF